MINLLAHILRWLFSKTAMLLVLWVVVLGAVALYLANEHYFRQLPDALAQREAELAEIQEKANRLREQTAAFEKEVGERVQNFDAEIAALRSTIDQQREQLETWRRRLQELEGVRGRAMGLWDRLRGIDPESEAARVQQRMDAVRARQQAIANQVAEAAEAKETFLHEAGTQGKALRAEQAATESQVARTEEEVAELRQQVHGWKGRVEKATFWLRGAYHQVGKPLVIISLSLLLAPIVGKCLLYYLWAPLVAAGRPVIIKTPSQAPIRVSPTAVAQEIVLQPGQSATIQHRFYQASDEDLRKRTKFLFSWRYPFSSLACGLFLLTRVTNETREQARRLTLSSQDEAEVEMAVVEIPTGGSLICRPSFISAVIEGEGKEPVVRSHWRFFSLHSWITLQFRYFEFRGPVKLVLWAYRGVRAERLTEENVIQANERRTNQLATIGFTPSLRYRSRRSETFISYLRKQNPLFDDLFSGHGVFLCQQISRAEHARQSGKFWAQLWNGVTKIIGI